jgi:hypothetical protein
MMGCAQGQHAAAAARHAGQKVLFFICLGTEDKLSARTAGSAGGTRLFTIEYNLD